MSSIPIPPGTPPDHVHRLSELLHKVQLVLPYEKSIFVKLKQYIRNDLYNDIANGTHYQLVKIIHNNNEIQFFYNSHTCTSDWSYPITDQLIKLITVERKKLNPAPKFGWESHNSISDTNTPKLNERNISYNHVQYTPAQLHAISVIQRTYHHYVWRCRYRVYHVKQSEKLSMNNELQQRLLLGKQRINTMRLSKRASGDTMPLMVRTNTTAAQSKLTIVHGNHRSRVNESNKYLSPQIHRTASMSDSTQLSVPHVTPPHKRYYTSLYVLSPQQRLTLANNIRFIHAIVTIQRKFRKRRQRARQRLSAKLEAMRYIELHDIDRHVRASLKLGKHTTKQLRDTLKRRGSVEPLKLSVYADRLAAGEELNTFDIITSQTCSISPSAQSIESRSALRSHLRRREVNDIDVQSNDIPIETTMMTLQITGTQPTPLQFRHCSFTPESLIQLQHNTRFMKFIIRMQLRWRNKRRVLQKSRQQTLRRLTTAKRIELAADLQHRLTIGKKRNTTDINHIKQPVTPVHQPVILHSDTVISSPGTIAHRRSLRSNINRRSGAGLQTFIAASFDHQAQLIHQIQTNLNNNPHYSCTAHRQSHSDIHKRSSLDDDYNINHAAIQSMSQHHIHCITSIQLRFRYRRYRARRTLLRRISSIKLDSDVVASLTVRSGRISLQRYQNITIPQTV